MAVTISEDVLETLNLHGHYLTGDESETEELEVQVCCFCS